MKKIAELLPEGLTEETLDQIAGLVQDTIQEQVDKEVTSLNAKVSTFLRMKMDAIKEQAMKELEAENDTFYNARLFEEVRSILAIDISEQDADSKVSTVMTTNTELTEEVELLSEELAKALETNSKLYDTATSLAKRVKVVESTLEDINEEKSLLEESLQEAQNDVEPFHSSEQALVLTEDSDREPEEAPHELNELLTPEVMRLMPHNS